MGSESERQKAPGFSEVWQHRRSKCFSFTCLSASCIHVSESQDLEEIEEWNEYGELKQQIGSVPPVTATPTSSNSNTPSKGPRMPSATLLESSPAAMSPRSASPSRGSHHIQIMDPAEEPSTPKKEETPLTLAMRQAGEEAARKAGDKKIADKHQSTQIRSAGISIADSKKLDDSAAIPPPSGTTEAGAAVKPTPVTADREEEMAQPSAESPKGMRTSITEETRPKSSPLTQESAAESTASLQLEASDEKSPIYLHRGSSISMASKDEIAEVEKSQAIMEEDEGDDSEACVPTGSPKIAGTTATTGVTSSTKEENPTEASGKTQAQGAKEYGNAGVSVGD